MLPDVLDTEGAEQERDLSRGHDEWTTNFPDKFVCGAGVGGRDVDDGASAPAGFGGCGSGRADAERQGREGDPDGVDPVAAAEPEADDSGVARSIAAG